VADLPDTGAINQQSYQQFCGKLTREETALGLGL
jgi:hypothetical protein